MLSRFEKQGIENKETQYFRTVTDLGEAEELFQKLRTLEKEQWTAFEIIEDSSREEDFVGIALAFGEKEIYFLRPEGFLTREYLLESALRQIEGS